MDLTREAMEQIAKGLRTIADALCATEETKQEPAEKKPAKQKKAAKVPYDDVKNAIIELVQLDRQAAVAILKKYEVTKGDQLHEEQYPAVLKDLKAKIKQTEEAEALVDTQEAKKEEPTASEPEMEW